MASLTLLSPSCLARPTLAIPKSLSWSHLHDQDAPLDPLQFQHMLFFWADLPVLNYPRNVNGSTVFNNTISFPSSSSVSFIGVLYVSWIASHLTHAIMPQTGPPLPFLISVHGSSIYPGTSVRVTCQTSFSPALWLVWIVSIVSIM